MLAKGGTGEININNRFHTTSSDAPAGGIPSAQQAADRAAEIKWADRLVGAGSLLTLLFQIAYLFLDRSNLSLSHPLILLFHLICIGLFAAAALMTLDVRPWIRRSWKWIAFSFSTIMIASMAAIAILTGQTEPLFIALILFLAGTGPFLSWGERTQALLSVVAFAAVGAVVAGSPAGLFSPYEFVGIVIGAAIGLFTTALERRLRRARRRAEEEMLKGRETLLLQERLRLAGQLASGIAHDLNNTLNVVKLRLDALAQDDAVQSRHAARLRAIDHAIENAARTVARVRELGKAREENFGEPVQLCEVIAQAIELARSSIEGRPSLNGASIKITSKVPDQLPAVRAPAPDLRQVFLNLLLNASEAIQPRGEITIESSVDDGSVVVRVTDDGPGIAPEHIERVFEPFFTTKGPHGAGLGLSTTRAIMDSIGGSICAANQPGGGAMFVLRFPAATPPAAEIGSRPVIEAPRSCRFLLVDDDAENLDSLTENLVRRGHQVDAALSGPQALEKLRSGAVYDVILCDLGMPGMSGWEVARLAREIAAGVDFYIVTGWGREIEGEIPASVSVSGVLAKPIDLNEVARIAALAVANRDAAQGAGVAAGEPRPGSAVR
jgi:signal transduction histidine kinase/CheY-like chemotaxis protein